MILVFGKKDKALVVEAQDYIRICAKYYMEDTKTTHSDACKHYKKCEKIADRLLNCIGIKVK